MEDSDLAFALQLQEQLFDIDEDFTNGNADRKHRRPTSSGDRSISLVDPFWETADPNPDIRALFLEFNERFFWGRLAGIEVKWSPRMTLCAGLCCYEGRGGLCSVRLSVPLLKLRPRKDLVETLLHEMIHAYLFVTENNKDHDGHGHEFHKHMYRINKETGTNISVYHNFHDEVDLYKQHWWRCDGPCRSRKPYFGYVKRAMNRAPSKNDTWWDMHEKTCGGKYTKVKEPEDYGKKKQKNKDMTESKSKGKASSVKSMDIRIFGGVGKPLGQPKTSDTIKPNTAPSVTSSSKHTGVVNKPGVNVKPKPSVTVTKPGDMARPSATITSGTQPAESASNCGSNIKSKPSFSTSNFVPNYSINKPQSGKSPKHSPSKTKLKNPGALCNTEGSSNGRDISNWFQNKTQSTSRGGSASAKKKEDSFGKKHTSSSDNTMKKVTCHDSDFSDSDDELLGAIPLDGLVKSRKDNDSVSKRTVGLSKQHDHDFRETHVISTTKAGVSNKSSDPSGRTLNASSHISKVTAKDMPVSGRTSDISDNVDATAITDDPNDVRAMLRKVWGQKQQNAMGKTTVKEKRHVSVDKISNRKRLSDDLKADFQECNKKCRINDSCETRDHFDRKDSGKQIDWKKDGLSHSKFNASDQSFNSFDGSSDTGRFTEGEIKNKDKIKSCVDENNDKISVKKKYSNEGYIDLSGDTSNSQGSNSSDVVNTNHTELSTCPVCCEEVPVPTINDHLDLCLTLKAIS